MAEWYYMKEGEKCGPLSSTDLKSMAVSGRIKPDDGIWKEGIKDWVPAHKVRGLFEDEVNNETKKCPYCAEVIAQAAIKCKHCGEHLDNREGIQNQRSPILSVTPVGNGVLKCAGDYLTLYGIMRETLSVLGGTIKTDDVDGGKLETELPPFRRARGFD